MQFDEGITALRIAVMGLNLLWFGFGSEKRAKLEGGRFCWVLLYRNDDASTSNCRICSYKFFVLFLDETAYLHSPSRT